MNPPRAMNRRAFLHHACAGLAAASAAAMCSRLRMIDVAMGAELDCAGYAPVGDYKALVCVFLFGGNDSFNLLVPTDAERNAVYRASRGAMAITEGLLPIDVLGADGGQSYAMHPATTELAGLFNAGHAAFVVNTGTVLEPTNKTQYLSGSQPLPPQLFSHADQQAQWQYGQPMANGNVGWGGLVADRLQVLNPGMTIPMSISLAGQNRFQAGASVQPYSLGIDGPTPLSGYTGADNSAQAAALEALMEQAYPDPMTRTYASQFHGAMDYYTTMTNALADAPDFAGFPADNGLAAALQQVAKVIWARDTLKARRQIFFVALGGFDTHDDMLEDQPVLFATLSQALKAFYDATATMQVENSVTTFTMSEFSRTLNTDGDGTDHAWGGQHLVMGGAVQGQRLYGTPAASGQVFPDLTLDGPDCLQRGQMVPATSCDQYTATLARWFGVNDCDIATIFPYVNNFLNQAGNTTWDLGFMT